MPNEDIAILNPFNAMPAEQAIMVAVCGMVVVFLMLIILALVIRINSYNKSPVKPNIIGDPLCQVISYSTIGSVHYFPLSYRLFAFHSIDNRPQCRIKHIRTCVIRCKGIPGITIL